ncbi:MAG: bifunctional oligoribonuclease/PAP phosphatase NrnA [Deltaproteobacteria bacterium]|nr:bifunctional oligoribonuclease/PAP phosphatase NrnA [Deltaproteobacteria bacterium]
MTKKSSIFEKARSFLIVSHYHPDGDAIGASLALSLGLKKLGKKAVVYNRDAVPFNLGFLPSVGEVTQTLPKEKLDCAVMVDCAQPKRVSDDFAKAVDAKQFGTLVCIDHHLLDHKVGDIDWIEPEAASTGSVVWHILGEMGIQKDAAIANLIFCTLTVDTGSFRYSNTTDKVFALAAELVRAGADPWFVAGHMEESNPVERFRLLRQCLGSLVVKLNGNYASMEITKKMLQDAGADEGLSDEFANIPRSIAGVEVAALFREIEDGKIKVSLRSKEKVDVSKVAKQFAGGGHEHAAGCNLKCSLAEAKKQIETAVGKALEMGSSLRLT